MGSKGRFAVSSRPFCSKISFRPSRSRVDPQQLQTSLAEKYLAELGICSQDIGPHEQALIICKRIWVETLNLPPEAFGGQEFLQMAAELGVRAAFLNVRRPSHIFKRLTSQHTLRESPYTLDSTEHFDLPELGEGPELASRDTSEQFLRVENDLHTVVVQWADAFTSFFLKNPCEVSNPFWDAASTSVD